MSTLGIRIALKVMRIPIRLLNRLEVLEKQRYCTVGSDVVLHPQSRIVNNRGDKSVITIGNSSHIAGQLMVFGHAGVIRIGDACYVGENSHLWSADSITVGDRVLISHNVNIHDTNAHSLSAQHRHQHELTMISTGHPKHLDDVPAAPIVIEDDVWIGFNCTVLKGVTIGRGAVIGSGTTVTKDVAPFTVLVGNPPRVVGNSRP